MKKSIVTLCLAGCMVAMGIAACSSNEKKVENATEDLKEAKAELQQEKRDSVSDYLKFKQESDARIAENENTISTFKENMKRNGKAISVSDQKAIDVLEQRNIDLRKKIAEFKENGKDNWAAFKTEFNHDLDHLSEALKNLTISNTK